MPDLLQILSMASRAGLVLAFGNTPFPDSRLGLTWRFSEYLVDNQELYYDPQALEARAHVILRRAQHIRNLLAMQNDLEQESGSDRVLTTTHDPVDGNGLTLSIYWSIRGGNARETLYWHGTLPLGHTGYEFSLISSGGLIEENPTLSEAFDLALFPCDRSQHRLSTDQKYELLGEAAAPHSINHLSLDAVLTTAQNIIPLL